MNSQIEDLMDRAGLLADGCWDKMDDYTRQAIEKFAELIIKECLTQADMIRDGCEQDAEYEQSLGADWVGLAIERHFGNDE